MASTMDKLKDKLHIRRKSISNEGEASYSSAEGHGLGESRGSFDSEFERMTPAEREAYLKEFEDAEREDLPKKSGLLERLIARGNKRTEEQLAQEHREREELAAKRASTAGAGGQHKAPSQGVMGSMG